MISIVRGIIFSICIMGVLLNSAISETIPTEKQIISWLKVLKPLQKVHYSYPLPLGKISDDLLFEYARITQAISLSGEWNKEKDVDRSVRIALKINKISPEKTVSIGINYSIWHREFGKELLPTDIGKTHQEELKLLKTKLELIRDRLFKANKKYNGSIKVGRILFDSERFHIKKGNLSWNEAITAKYDSATKVVKKIFPTVKIEWYARGAVQQAASGNGWEVADLFSLKEKGNSFNCSLYRVPEIGITREIFRKTVKLAHKYDQKEVTPWVALASGYRRQVDEFQVWSADWDYDLIYSWKLGAEINQPWFSQPTKQQRFAPWDMAKTVIFYPPPFDERTPSWSKHFVAYVRGAHDIKSLP